MDQNNPRRDASYSGSAPRDNPISNMINGWSSTGTTRVCKCGQLLPGKNRYSRFNAYLISIDNCVRFSLNRKKHLFTNGMVMPDRQRCKSGIFSNMNNITIPGTGICCYRRYDSPLSTFIVTKYMRRMCIPMYNIRHAP